VNNAANLTYFSGRIMPDKNPNKPDEQCQAEQTQAKQNTAEQSQAEHDVSVDAQLISNGGESQMVHHAGEQPTSEQLVFTPAIDIYESEEGLVLYADLPGVSSETLELQVQDNKLTLFGHVTTPIDDDAIIQHCEYQIGDFLRSFILSDEVNHEQIKATLNHGVLKVVLPKAPQTEVRHIQVHSD